MKVIRFEDVYQEDIWVKRSEELESLDVSGVCIYTDGGYKPRIPTPNASWGLHAFFYKAEKPNKTSRYKGAFPTKDGYVDKLDDKNDMVTPIKLFNSSGLITTEQSTNNIAELQAFILALDLIIETNLKNFIDCVAILSDSEYVLRNSSISLTRWKKNNWKTGSGKPVANVEYWEVISKQLDTIDELGLTISYKHVAGHVDYGNIIADRWCTLALNDKIEMDEYCDEEWYADNTVYLDPLLIDQKYLHFPGLIGKYNDYAYMYSMFKSQIPVSSLGCRLEDVSIAVIKTTDEVTLSGLKKVHRECVEFEESITPVPMVVELNDLLSNKFNHFLSNGLIKKLGRVEDIDKITINNPVNNAPVIQIISPPRNSFKALDEYKKAIGVLDDLYDEHGEALKTDITDLLFGEVTKGKKKSLEFLLKVGDTVEVDASCSVMGEKKTSSVILTFGLDLPSRRMFYNLIDSKPKVYVVTWEYGEYSFRYGVLIETDTSVGFWLTPFSNTQLLLGD